MTFSPVRRFGTAVLLVCALCAPAFAQAPAAKAPTPEHIALARAVLDFTGARKSFDNVVPKLLTDARNVILRTRPTLQPDLDAAAMTVATKLANADEELVSQIAIIYAQKFNETELKEIAAFYQSPTGKKMTAELPSVLGESYKLLGAWSQRLSLTIMDSLREEMKKKGHDI
jgi:hypothetical protein